VGGSLFAVQTYIVTNLRTLYAILPELDPSCLHDQTVGSPCLVTCEEPLSALHLQGVVGSALKLSGGMLNAGPRHCHGCAQHVKTSEHAKNEESTHAVVDGAT
jgi:hypothetical protein